MQRYTRVQIFLMMLLMIAGLGECNSLKTVTSNEEYTVFRSQETPHAIFYHHSGEGPLKSKFLYDVLFIYEALLCIAKR